MAASKAQRMVHHFYAQAGVTILFVPVVASLLIIAALAGNERESVPDGDRTVTGSVR